MPSGKPAARYVRNIKARCSCSTTDSRANASAIVVKRMLRRYDLCERAARVMWIELLKMNRCKSWRGLAAKILRDHPQLDPEVVQMKVWNIRETDN